MKIQKVRSWIALALTYFGVGVIYFTLLPLYLFNIEYFYHINRKIGTTYVVSVYKLLGLRVILDGEMPKVQNVTVSNHQHTFDTMILPYIAKTRSTHIAKQFHKIFIQLRDFICVRGSDKVSTGEFLSRIKKECLLQKKSIVIFPEGARIPINEVVKYETTPALLARYLNLPILPISMNTGHVFESNKSSILDFSIPLKVKIHPLASYEEILFRSLYLGDTDDFTNCSNLSIQELKTILIHLTKVEVQTKDLLQFLYKRIEILAHLSEYKTTLKVLEKDISQIIADYPLPEHISSKVAKDLCQKISHAHNILFKVIPEKSNKEKDERVTNWLQKTIEGK
jgi:1-acyl-sn-glycerol-3-phosphate acyltransferase